MSHYQLDKWEGLSKLVLVGKDPLLEGPSAQRQGRVHGDHVTRGDLEGCQQN